MGRSRHIIESQQFDLEFMATLFEKAERFSRDGFDGNLSRQVMASLFYEPSTRTRFSLGTKRIS